MKRRTIRDIGLDAVVYGTLVLMAFATLLPFLNVLSKSVSEEWAVVSGKVGVFPVGFQFETMKFVITSYEFLRSFSVSIYITVVGTLLSLLLTAISAYPLSKRHLPGIKFIMLLFVFTMLFGGGIIPNYLLIRSLGLIDSLWALILPSLISVFNLLVIKSYFEGLPESLEESARIDGARTLTILFRILLPLCGPVLATIALFYAVGYWNEFFNAMIYINSPSLKPLQLYLRDIVLNAASATAGIDRTADELMNLSPDNVRSATVIASTIPILIVYPLLQKYFIKGVLIGSVKG
ncbi:carbohydrate ABC transporter permease [Paenibacillus mesophilus]|uniref:carbohydrate ABC transporter permease n=1 Tax=Paenibacillus mesophilus TaxID=2582849 RepID=UPI00110F5E99|nr:carbohydrate ABC transporter permease [Paenibacillus mesophilus]TMV47875.1 carbohydrate ABC transporter permease [Paenibacillus mesophilus]